MRIQRVHFPFRQGALWIGILVGTGATWGILTFPYINWQAVVAPVDERPLVIRLDAKGDGRYQAPRSGNRRHGGIDLAAPLDSPVRAIRSGTVIQVGTHRGRGNFVDLEHGGQLGSRYAHLETILVKTGQRVKQGQMIGTVGKTGNARHPWIMPHVHLELTRKGHRIDPTTLGLDVVVASNNGRSTDGRGGE